MDRQLEERLEALEKQLKRFVDVMEKGLGRDLARPINAVRDGYYEAALTNSGSIIEAMLRDVWQHEGIKGEGKKKTIEQLFSVVKERAEMDRLVQDYVRDIQLVRNRAAHGEEIVAEDSVEALRKLAVILEWYFCRYVNPDGPTDEPIAATTPETMPRRRRAVLPIALVTVVAMVIALVFVLGRDSGNSSGDARYPEQRFKAYFGAEAPADHDTAGLQADVYVSDVEFSEDYLEEIEWHFSGEANVTTDAKRGAYQITADASVAQALRNYFRNLSAANRGFGVEEQEQLLVDIFRGDEEFFGDEIDVDLKDVRLRDALTFAAMISPLQMVVHPLVESEISMRGSFRWDQFLWPLITSDTIHAALENDVLFVGLRPGNADDSDRAQTPFFFPVHPSQTETATDAMSAYLDGTGFVYGDSESGVVYGGAEESKIAGLAQMLEAYGIHSRGEPIAVSPTTPYGEVFDAVSSGIPSTVVAPLAREINLNPREINVSGLTTESTEYRWTGDPVTIRCDRLDSDEFGCQFVGASSDVPYAFTTQLADLRGFSDTFVRATDLDIAYAQEVRPTRILPNLRDVPWDQALHLFFTLNDLDYRVESKILHVFPADTGQTRWQEGTRIGQQQSLVCAADTIAGYLNQLAPNGVTVTPMPGQAVLVRGPVTDATFLIRTARVLETYLCIGDPGFVVRRQYEELQAYLDLVGEGRTAEATNRIRSALEHLPGDRWIIPVFRFFAGEIGEADVLEAARNSDSTTELEQLCEAHYYLGMSRLVRNDLAGARDHFEASVATEVEYFFEFEDSKAHLVELAGAAY